MDVVDAGAGGGFAEAPEGEPRLGGSLANVAVAAARFGAAVEFVGGAGDDDWGWWLRREMAHEGVDVEGFVLAAGTTSVASVALSEAGEPSFTFHEAAERPVAHAGESLELALAGPAGVFVGGSDTLLSGMERDVTLRGARRARELGWTLVADPNLRRGRWPDPEAVAGAVEELIATCHVLKLNAAEAMELSGELEVGSAIEVLLARGPRAVIATRGPEGALVATRRGVSEVPAASTPARVDATGAGDCVTGVIAAGIAAGAPLDSLEPVVAVAMEAAAAVVGRWGASAGLPPAGRARAALDAAVAQ